MRQRLGDGQKRIVSDTGIVLPTNGFALYAPRNVLSDNPRKPSKRKNALLLALIPAVATIVAALIQYHPWAEKVATDTGTLTKPIPATPNESDHNGRNSFPSSSLKPQDGSSQEQSTTAKKIKEGRSSEQAASHQAPAQQGSAAKDQASVQSQEADGFLFELKSCQRFATAVNCNMSITNARDDRQLRIMAAGGAPQSSRAVDDHGGEYRATHIRFGTQEGPLFAIATMASGVSQNATITFEKIAPDASAFKLFELGCRGGHSEYFTLQMHDIPLTKP